MTELANLRVVVYDVCSDCNGLGTRPDPELGRVRCQTCAGGGDSEERMTLSELASLLREATREGDLAALGSARAEGSE